MSTFVIKVHQYVSARTITSLCVQRLRFVSPSMVNTQTDIHTHIHTYRQTDKIWSVYMNSSAN